MTERVTVEGRGLAVTVEEADDPKRLRPNTYTPSSEPVRSKAGRTLEQIIAEPNPYWPDQDSARRSTRGELMSAKDRILIPWEADISDDPDVLSAWIATYDHGVYTFVPGSRCLTFEPTNGPPDSMEFISVQSGGNMPGAASRELLEHLAGYPREEK